MTNLGKVLLVDDDETSNYISAHALQIANVTEQITVVRNGCQALKLLQEEAFDTILLDINMPVMDGFQFLEALKSLQEGIGTAAPATFVLTTSENQADKARAAKYPIKGYLLKPLTQAQVKRLIRLAAKGAA